MVGGKNEDGVWEWAMELGVWGDHPFSSVLGFKGAGRGGIQRPQHSLKTPNNKHRGKLWGLRLEGQIRTYRSPRSVHPAPEILIAALKYNLSPTMPFPIEVTGSQCQISEGGKGFCYCSDEETTAQTGEITCSTSHSYWVAEWERQPEIIPFSRQAWHVYTAPLLSAHRLSTTAFSRKPGVSLSSWPNSPKAPGTVWTDGSQGYAERSLFFFFAFGHSLKHVGS